MTESEFMKFVKNYLNDKILPTMVEKGLGQYSNNNDRFHNFKKISGLKGESKEKCLTDLVVKQIVCLYDQMDKWNKGEVFYNKAFATLIDEVLKDIIIYLFILKGMFYEYEIVKVQE